MENLLFEMPAWQIFAAIGISLCVLEIFVPGFIVLPIGLGFLLTAPIAAGTTSFALQLAGLSVSQVIVFLLIRRFVPYSQKPAVYSGTEGMIGKECQVIESISAAQTGYVKLYGDRWQAMTFSTKTLPAGSRATILKVEGNKVLVEPLETEEK